eukprot:6210102-Pleurochrysis_carterae.AAC.2
MEVAILCLRLKIQDPNGERRWLSPTVCHVLHSAVHDVDAYAVLNLHTCYRCSTSQRAKDWFHHRNSQRAADKDLRV